MDTSTFPEKNSATTAGAASEMAALKEELDSLTSRIARMSELELADAKERLLKKMESAEAAAHSVASAVTQQLNQGVDVTTDYVKERPLKSMAVVAGIGLLLGMLISRR